MYVSQISASYIAVQYIKLSVRLVEGDLLFTSYTRTPTHTHTNTLYIYIYIL